MTDEFEIPTTVFHAMKKLIDEHTPMRVSGRPTQHEGLSGMVITLHCDDQRDGVYQVRYLILGNGEPIAMPTKE
jgi:hypothetical protein